MRAIRAWHASSARYTILFREIANLSYREYHELEERIGELNTDAFDHTNRLTHLREGLASLGYEKEVAETDRQFLAAHCGHPTQESWEEFWEGYCKRHKVAPYPEDAL